MNDLKQIKEFTHNTKLLYVEDELNIRDHTSIFLNKFFDDITVAIDGQDGLDKFKSTVDFDIVMTDINMPKLNGIEMIKSIKELKKEIIVIYFSADDLMETIVKNENTYLLKKPVTIESFISLLEEISLIVN